jgi:hypothetical protein
MKAFRFPLDRALHIRRTQLEIERAKLQKLTNDREQLELQATELLLESVNTRRTILTQGLVTAGEISTMPDYQRNTREHLRRLDRQKQDLLKKTESQMHQAVEAERKVKLLERLRGQRFAEWNSLAQKEQENFIADAYLARWTVSH